MRPGVTILKTDPTANAWIFKTAGEGSVMKSHFIKVIGEILRSTSFSKLYHVHWYLPKRSFSRSFNILTEVIGLQSTDCKATKYGILTKCLKIAPKILEKRYIMQFPFRWKSTSTNLISSVSMSAALSFACF